MRHMFHGERRARRAHSLLGLDSAEFTDGSWSPAEDGVYRRMRVDVTMQKSFNVDSFTGFELQTDPTRAISSRTSEARVLAAECCRSDGDAPANYSPPNVYRGRTYWVVMIGFIG